MKATREPPSEAGAGTEQVEDIATASGSKDEEDEEMGGS